MSRLSRLIEARRRQTNLRLLWVSQFVNTAGLMMLAPIMPLHMDRLGAGPETVGLWAGAAVAVPALPLALTTPFWGRLGDRVGRKWMVVRALVGLSLAMGVMAMATSPFGFIVARLMQGSLGGVVEAAAAFVGSDGDDDDRGSSLGRSYSATAAGSLAGPIIGGLLVSTGGLGVLLTGTAAAALLLSILCAVSLRERPENRVAHHSVDADRSASFHGTFSRIGWATLAAGFFAYFGVYGLIPVYAEHVRTLVDRPEAAGPWIGGLHAVMWSGTLVGSLWWGRRNDRSGLPLRTLSVAATVTALVIVAQAATPSLLALAPLRFAQGFCFAALSQSVILHASKHAPAGRRAGYVGIANSSLLAGQFAGPLIAGGILGLFWLFW